MVSPRPALSEEIPVSDHELGEILKSRRSTVEFTILRATKILLASTGLGVSMDAIAREAGISRRTLFRHFPVRDELVARALDESVGYFHLQALDTFASTVDTREWLREVVAALHSMQLRAGRGIWQMAASEDSELPEPIATVNKKRRENRHHTTEIIAQEAWRRFGQQGKAPREVEIVFALTFSSFAARSLNFDYDVSQQESVHALAEFLAGYLETTIKNR